MMIMTVMDTHTLIGSLQLILARALLQKIALIIEREYEITHTLDSYSNTLK